MRGNYDIISRRSRYIARHGDVGIPISGEHWRAKVERLVKKQIEARPQMPPNNLWSNKGKGKCKGDGKGDGKGKGKRSKGGNGDPSFTPYGKRDDPEWFAKMGVGPPKFDNQGEMTINKDKKVAFLMHQEVFCRYFITKCRERSIAMGQGTLLYVPTKHYSKVPYTHRCGRQVQLVDVVLPEARRSFKLYFRHFNQMKENGIFDGKSAGDRNKCYDSCWKTNACFARIIDVPEHEHIRLIPEWIFQEAINQSPLR